MVTTLRLIVSLLDSTPRLADPGGSPGAGSLAKCCSGKRYTQTGTELSDRSHLFVTDTCPVWAKKRGFFAHSAALQGVSPETRVVMRCGATFRPAGGCITTNTSSRRSARAVG